MAESVEVIGRGGINNVGFAGNEIARFSVGDIGGDFEDCAAKFVTDDACGFDAIAGPVIPVVDVKIGATEGGAFNLEFDGARSEFWFGCIYDLEPWCGLRLCNRFHGRGFTLGLSLTIG